MNENRHILLDTTTKDVYSQTEKRTMRIGQAVEVKLWSPPWESKFDEIATGMVMFANYPNNSLHMIEEGTYTYPDPDLLDKPDDWTPEDVDNPIPEKMRERNPETANHPPVEFDKLRSESVISQSYNTVDVIITFENEANVLRQYFELEERYRFERASKVLRSLQNRSISVPIKDEALQETSIVELQPGLYWLDASTHPDQYDIESASGLLSESITDRFVT